jgi:hypothetical protein
MIIQMVKVAGIAFASLCLTGCADQMVTLRYTPDPQIERLSTTRDVTIYKFADRRGDEGDHGDSTTLTTVPVRRRGACPRGA